MSYEIVRSIKITDDAVYFRADSNNVSPRDFTCSEWPYFTAILKEQGKEAVELVILRMYEEGNFQPGVPNKYSRAIDRLRSTPEYAPFDWRSQDIPYYEDIDGKMVKTAAWQALDDLRQSPAFDALLLNSLKGGK